MVLEIRYIIYFYFNNIYLYAKTTHTKINAWILYKFPKDKQKKTKYYFIDQFTVGDILINTLITKNN